MVPRKYWIFIVFKWSFVSSFDLVILVVSVILVVWSVKTNHSLLNIFSIAGPSGILGVVAAETCDHIKSSVM